MAREEVEPYWYPHQEPMESTDVLQGLYLIQQAQLLQQEQSRSGMMISCIHRPEGTRTRSKKQNLRTTPACLRRLQCT
eukprot:2838693-Prorocentrum_lima.AAC.1